MGCVGNCPGDCPANTVCTGNQPDCPLNGKNGTGWDETIVVGVTDVKASHLAELELAINAERVHVSRRGALTQTACTLNTPGPWTFFGSRGVGDIIDHDHNTQVAHAVNSTPYNVNGNTQTPAIIIDGRYTGQNITKGYIDSLRAAINSVESYCICDSYLVGDCGCNGECVTDNPY